jgi:excisionase family DNA binding protein
MQEVFQAPGPYHAPGSVAERLLTFREAADAVGARYWHIQRAVRRGAIPSYTPYNSRRLVKLSEVVAHINSCRRGGADDR